MNKLKDLMQKLCPNGVEYKKLADCCVLEKGCTPIQKAIPGEYPLVVTTEERKSCSTYQFDKPTVCIPLVSSRGHGVASLNRLYYQDGKFALGNILCGVTPTNSDELSAKFLFYYLNHKKDALIVPLMRGGANVSLTVDSLKKVKVPVPPISVQYEIIRIFSKFDELGIELEAEYIARKKQYEHYRDVLLNGNDSASIISLKDVIIKSCSGSTPTKGKAEFYENGTIPWIRTQDVRFNEIVEVNSFITEEAVKKTAVKWIPANCVIVAISGATAGRCAINKIPTTTNQHCLNLEIDHTKAHYKYVFYCIYAKYEELLSKKQGARGDLNSSLILGLSIPLPSLEEQSRIVSVLDYFDSLCNNSSAGLPAEINARQKQYKYYRDKLLTFKQLP